MIRQDTWKFFRRRRFNHRLASWFFVFSDKECVCVTTFRIFYRRAQIVSSFICKLRTHSPASAEKQIEISWPNRERKRRIINFKQSVFDIPQNPRWRWIVYPRQLMLASKRRRSNATTSRSSNCLLCRRSPLHSHSFSTTSTLSSSWSQSSRR